MCPPLRGSVVPVRWVSRRTGFYFRGCLLPVTYAESESPQCDGLFGLSGLVSENTVSFVENTLSTLVSLTTGANM